MIKEKNKEGFQALFIDRSQAARTPLTQGKNNEKFEPFKYTWVTPANAGKKYAYILSSIRKKVKA